MVNIPPVAAHVLPSNPPLLEWLHLTPYVNGLLRSEQVLMERMRWRFCRFGAHSLGRNGEKLEAPSRGSSSSSTEVTINVLDTTKVWINYLKDKLTSEWIKMNEEMNRTAEWMWPVKPCPDLWPASVWVLGACPGLSRLVTPARAPPTWRRIGVWARWNLSIQRYPIWDAKREAWMTSHGHSHLWNPSGKNVTHLLASGLD